MVNFQYYNPSKIIFGKGSIDKLKDLLKQSKVTSLLLVYSGDFIKELGIYNSIIESAKELNIKLFENGNVVPNPRVELVRELVDLGKKENIDFVLAVGGGSAIDTAKAVSIGIPYSGDVWDFFSQDITLESAVPVGVITTLPSSGSETSNCAILSNGLHKKGFEHDSIIPQFAIMDPEYTVGLPVFQTASGVADILSHLLERYFSDVSHTDLTDYMIEGSIKALLLNGERVLENPNNYDARAEIQWIASVAHNNILDTGRIGDWGSHRIEHELSAQYDVTHGEGMAIVFPAWIRYAGNIKPHKLAQLANRVFDVDYNDFSEKEMAVILAGKFSDFFKKLGLKSSLSDLEIDNSHFAEMANRATNNGQNTVGHYLELNEKQFIDILNIALK